MGTPLIFATLRITESLLTYMQQQLMQEQLMIQQHLLSALGNMAELSHLQMVQLSAMVFMLKNSYSHCKGQGNTLK